jgi:hypothetical protein
MEGTAARFNVCGSSMDDIFVLGICVLTRLRMRYKTFTSIAAGADHDVDSSMRTPLSPYAATPEAEAAVDAARTSPRVGRPILAGMRINRAIDIDRDVCSGCVDRQLLQHAPLELWNSVVALM